jgi:predicted lipoprotein with Yx(FWY)xxD motif/uncharacterized cupredoxin-like copper-binding protein
MRHLRWMLAMLLVPTLLLGLAATAFATTSSTPEADEAAQPTVFVRQDPTLGPILTDQAGMTLYLFTNDTTAGESTCYDKCAENWPPFMAEEPFSLPFTMEGELTTVQRTDGSTQVAYNGIPLYYFVKDTGAGDTNGQGVGDVWYTVAPNAEFGAGAPSPMATPDMAMATPAMSGDVEVTLLDGVVESSVVTFKVGETYTFNVMNSGALAHEFVIEKAGAIDEPLEADGGEAEIEPFDAGTSQSIDFTFTEAGTYQFSCHVPGHYAAGMTITIHVVE